MAGFPVVISERGVPFVAVEKGAPLATVAENGRGLPIRVVEKGAPPLVVEGAEPDFEPMGFTLTSGASQESGDTGYYRTIYGSIGGQPVEGFPLVEFATRNSGYFQIALEGDCVSKMSGWRPVIDGVTLGDVIYEWEFSAGNTGKTWQSTGSMIDGAGYSITWEKES